MPFGIFYIFRVQNSTLLPLDKGHFITGEESLWDIAKKCGSTVAAIRSVNKLQEEPKPGQMLLIPVC